MVVLIAVGRLEPVVRHFSSSVFVSVSFQRAAAEVEMLPMAIYTDLLLN